MKFINADTIEKYNKFFGFRTQHPLVSVVHFDKRHKISSYRMSFGFYALYIKKTAGCVINYGKTIYDFDDDTVISFAPNQTVTVNHVDIAPIPKAVGLLFHPDLLHRTHLASKIKQFSFFSYASNEALHPSEEERIILEDYMKKIEKELEHPLDKFSKRLIISNIEVILNYCMRFYERQFVTRQELNSNVLIRFESLLDDYWDSGEARISGLPSVKYFADKICLSPNYFGDLVKTETGKTPNELIQFKMVELAKSAVLDPELNTKQVAHMLGFKHPQHFLRFFKRHTGYTVREFIHKDFARPKN